MNINSNHSQNHSHYSPIAYVEWASCIISIYSIWCWIILSMVNGVKDFKVCLIFLVGLLSHMYVWVVWRCCRSRGLGQAFESDTVIFIIFRWLPKICTHLPDHNTCKLLTNNNPTNPMAYDGCSLIHYMYYQRIIDKATIEFIFLPINTHTPLFYGLPKTLSSLPYYEMTAQYKMMVQLIVSHPILPTSSSLTLEIFYHTLKTQNISSTSFKIFYHSQPMHPWKKKKKKKNPRYLHRNKDDSSYASLFIGKEECSILSHNLLLETFHWQLFFIFLGFHTQLESLMEFMNTISPTIK